jgi:type II secretory pathway component PulK
MRCQTGRPQAGIALIIVMVVIIVLSIIAGGFAYSMKVETTLARNASYDHDLEWLGRSGVELARYVLAQRLEPYDSLNQKWAGGPGGLSETNNVLAGISLQDVELGAGRFSVKIVDQERKVNINLGDQATLQRALSLMGADAGNCSAVVDSILDWIDPDDDPHISGRESDYYSHLEPQPYVAKNGPLDDLAELLLVYGVTPEMYWGPAGTNAPVHSLMPGPRNGMSAPEQPNYRIGFVDLFTTLSARAINANTASETVLQLVPGVDENVALSIVRARAGPDGVDGTEDDIPFRTTAEIPIPRANPSAAGSLASYLSVQSFGFEVTVDAEIGGAKRQFKAMLWRNSPRDIQTLYFHAN